MANLLIDGCLLVSACLTLPQDSRPEWLSEAHSEGHRLWVYAGHWQSSLADLTTKLTDVGIDDAEMTAKSRLAHCYGPCQWLSALSEDAEALLDTDPIGAQLLKAAGRLNGDTLILTNDTSRLRNGHPFCGEEEWQVLVKSNSSVPLIDLAVQQDRLRPGIESAVHRVLHHGRYIHGPEIELLERRLADYVGVDHCIALSSGTDGLLLAMMAYGIGPGDEVITTAFSFASTAEAILLVGASPVFVDIDAATFNIDANLIEEKLSPRTRAILPVSLYGQCADFEIIRSIAKENDLVVIEDAAQSFGATQAGVRAGGLGTIGVTSFFPAKPLGAYGDAGACFTDDEDMMVRVRQLRDHGQDSRYHHVHIGINARMSSLQAAVLLEKLSVFDEELNARQSAAYRYQTLLVQAAESYAVDLPELAPGNTSSWAQYTVQMNERNMVQAALAVRGVSSAVHYPLPIPAQPALAGVACDCPVASVVAERVLSLPMHAYLDSRTQNHIVEQLIEVLGQTP